MRLPYIDALRGIAILGVIIVHTSQYGMNSFDHSFFSKFVSQGARGVQLFFLISAFTLFLSYKLRDTNAVNVNLNFYLRRVLRIAPMYYLGIAYYLWQDGFGPRLGLGNTDAVSVGNIIANLTFMHDLNPYWMTNLVPGGWSIAVEMSFYLFVPLLVKHIRSLNSATIFAILTLFICTFLDILFTKHPLVSNNELWMHYLFFYLPSQLPIFALGIVSYFLVVNNSSSVKPLTLIILSIVILSYTTWGLFIKPHILFGIGFLFLTYGLAQSELSLLVNRLTCYLGKISYSAYLTHFAVLHWLNEFELVNYLPFTNHYGLIANFVIRLIIVITITTIIATIFYHLVEKNFQHLGLKLTNRLDAKHSQLLPNVAKNE